MFPMVFTKSLMATVGEVGGEEGIGVGGEGIGG